MNDLGANKIIGQFTKSGVWNKYSNKFHTLSKEQKQKVIEDIQNDMDVGQAIKQFNKKAKVYKPNVITAGSVPRRAFELWDNENLVIERTKRKAIMEVKESDYPDRTMRLKLTVAGTVTKEWDI